MKKAALNIIAFYLHWFFLSRSLVLQSLCIKKKKDATEIGWGRKRPTSRLAINNQGWFCVFRRSSRHLSNRPVEGRRLHKVWPARRGRAGDPGAERHHTEGLVRADHRQVCQQSEQQQQGDTAVGRLSRTSGHAALRRADPPSDRPLQVHSTVATIQVPTRLYSLYPRILSISFSLSNSLSLLYLLLSYFCPPSIFTAFVRFFFSLTITLCDQLMRSLLIYIYIYIYRCSDLVSSWCILD